MAGPDPPAALPSSPDADAVALLPLAAIEQHGEHLPLSTDLDIALGLLEAALPKLRPGLPWCVLPPFAVGCSLEHGGFAGTLRSARRPRWPAWWRSAPAWRARDCAGW